MLQVVGYYLPSIELGGTVTAIADLVAALRLEGAEVDVVSTDARGQHSLPKPTAGDHAVAGARVTYFPASGPSRFYFSPRMVPHLARHVRNYDIVHLHGLWMFPIAAAARMARIAGVPYVVTLHGSLDPWALGQKAWKKQAYLRLVERSTLRHAAFIHYTASPERDSVPVDIRNLSSVTVPNCVDAAPFLDIGDPAVRRRSKDVLILGRIHLMKGFDVLIPAFAASLRRDPTLRLVVAGPDDDGYEARVRNLVNTHEILEAVDFVGTVNAEQRRQLFERAALLVCPSYRENFGMSVAEAMAAGLPVIVSDRVNINDDIESAGAGLVVERKVSTLADAIGRLMADADERMRMGMAGRRLVQESYSPRAVGRAMIDAYQQAVQD